jgi:hypothetical protein
MRVLPGDSIVCTASQLGSEHIRSRYIQQELDGVPVVGQEEKQHAVKKHLELVPRKRGGYFDIINPDNPGKPLNSKGLRLEEAQKVLEEMISNLSKEVILSSPNLDELDWDQLVGLMESKGIDMSDDYTTADDLREVLKAAE